MNLLRRIWRAPGTFVRHYRVSRVFASRRKAIRTALRYAALSLVLG